MDIYIIDGLNGIIDVVQSFQSVVWNVQFYGTGDFVLIVPGTSKNINLLRRGRYLVRAADIGTNEFRNVMVITDASYKYDVEMGWILELSGKGLKSLLNRRIVWKQTTLNGKIEAGVRQVVNDNVINPSDTARKLPGFVMDAAAGIPGTFETQIAGENVCEWLETVAETYGFGWDVYIKNGAYHFTLLKGTDRTYAQNAVSPVIFSPNFDNLLNAEYKQTFDDYQNAALIGGEGEGTEQVFATVGTAAGFNRYEGYIDGGSVSSNGEIITLATYIKLLKEYGKEQLTATQNTDHFSGEVRPYGQYKLNVDYFLGDKVQIELNDFRGVTRIIEVIYAEDINGSTLLPTFSEWEADV